MDLPKRKIIRLPGYDYDQPGYYFITICTREKKKLLCNITVDNLVDGAIPQMFPYGMIVEKYLKNMQEFYGDIFIDKFVVMPNHIHLLLHIPAAENMIPDKPMIKKNRIGRFVGTFKRLCNGESGENMWQSRSYDHVVRNEQDYQKIWNYIACNPGKWTEDSLFVE